MKIVKGRFSRHDDSPAAGAVLVFELSQDAKAIDGTEVKSADRIEITLDENGAIPRNTRIHANDELEPKGTYYTATLHDTDPERCEYSEWLKIVGRSPINLNHLIPEEKAPLPVHVPPPAGPAPRIPVPREPGSAANHVGFFGVTVNLPSKTGSTSLPSLDVSGTFGVCAFTLPSKAVVGCASIIVDSGERGKECVLALYDGDGKRVLTTRISVEKSGVASGALDAPAVHLDAGGYRLAWAIDRFSTTALLRSIDVNRDLFDLGNAGGGALLAGVSRSQNGGELPETLGDIAPGLCAPPVVFLKA